MSTPQEPQPQPLSTSTDSESRLTDLERQVLERFQANIDPDTDAFDFDNLPAKGPDGDIVPADSIQSDPTAPPGEPEIPAGPDEAPPAPSSPGVPAEGEESEVGEETDLVYVIGEDEYTEDEIAAGMQVKSWVEGLNETEIQTVDAALSGDYVLVPMSDIPAITAFYEARQNPPQTPQPTTQSTPRPARDPYEDYPDDTEDPKYAQLEAEVQQLRQRQEQEEQQRLYESTRTAVQAGSDAFWGQNPDLNSHDRDRLSNAVMQSGVYQQALGQGQTPDQAAFTALNAARNADPLLMQRTVDAQVAERLAQERVALQQQSVQTAGSTALAGSGASTNGTPMPMSLDEQRVEMIRRAMES